MDKELIILLGFAWIASVAIAYCLGRMHELGTQIKEYNKEIFEINMNLFELSQEADILKEREFAIHSN